MLNWVHQVMVVVSVAFVWGTIGLLTPTGSQAQLFGGLAPLERLTESGCVATPAWDEIIEGPARWVAKMDGAAYCDRQTGLVWEATPGRARFSWSEAQEYCLNRTVGGNGQLGWRLPEIMELSSLVDKNSNSCTRGRPTCLPDGSPFENFEVNPNWSATEVRSQPTNAWGVNFNGGKVEFNDKGTLNPVWCVRGG